MATKVDIYIGNSTVIELQNLRTSAGAYINDATVTVTLKDANGTNVVGETWPLAMAADGGTTGRYTATLVNTLTLTENALYIAEVTATANAGVGKWEYETRARVRD